MLEGSQECVESLYQNISSDALNINVKLLWKASFPERGFSEWSMAFTCLKTDPVQCPASSDFLMDGKIDGNLASVVITIKVLCKYMASEFALSLHFFHFIN